jgi:hypothetical protein
MYSPLGVKLLHYVSGISTTECHIALLVHRHNGVSRLAYFPCLGLAAVEARAVPQCIASWVDIVGAIAVHIVLLGGHQLTIVRWVDKVVLFGS